MSPMAGALRQAGALLAAGLLVQLVTMVWSHPTAFVIFVAVGALLVAAGVLRYLVALLLAAGSR